LRPGTISVAEEPSRVEDHAVRRDDVRGVPLDPCADLLPGCAPLDVAADVMLGADPIRAARVWRVDRLQRLKFPALVAFRAREFGYLERRDYA